ncbi:MAG TPA: adenylate/guanylate cyclase domain-containing protein [Woeseiaceae bacterium]|nr:adenylate/guanylate cyclase domain-containing protein [Woeseiaceae bacterium]
MERRLVAIFALDMVSFSRLVELDETGTLSRQKFHRSELIDPAIKKHRGRIVKGTGDGLLAEFSSAVDAVECAAEIQRAMPDRERDVPERQRIVFRIGLNVGDIVVEDGDIYGGGVNVAARLESEADPGGVFISGAVFNQVKHKVELGFEDLGPFRVKNIEEPVQVYRVLLDPADAGKVPGQKRRRRRFRLSSEAVAAVSVIVVIGGGFAIRDFVLRDTSRRDALALRSSPLEQLAEREDPRRVAVTYFEARTPQEEVPFIAAGLTEALIDELSSVDALSVVSRHGVARFRDAPVPPESIGRALRVGTLVDGTVSMADQGIRVAISFINASTGERFGTTRVEGNYEQLFQLQDDLVQEVGGFLLRTLGEEIEEIQLRATTDNVEAWALVQRASPVQERAQSLMQMGDLEAALQTLAAADSILALAEQKAPEWAVPTVQRGWLDYQASRFTGFEDRVGADQWIERGLDHAELAVRLAPENPDALELRGTLRYWRYLLNLGGGPAEAEELVQSAQADLRTSVSLNPDQASAWTSLSHLLVNQYRVAEGKVAALRSYEADPYLQNAHLTIWRLFGASFDLSDHVEAERWCEEGRRRFPERPRFRKCALWVQMMPGVDQNVDELWSTLAEWLELSRPDEREFNARQGQMFVALALAQAGMTDSAAAVALRARADASIDPTRNIAYWEAIVRSFLGDLDTAIEQFNIHLAANPDATLGDSWLEDILKQDPRFMGP